MTVEMVGPKYAAFTGMMLNIPFVAGELILVGLAWQFRDYRTLLKVAFVPAFCTMGIWFLIPESPRWLIAKNRLEEAKVIIVKASEVDVVLFQQISKFFKKKNRKN
jgi:OCT family organic cation transporter-like MFS transporter 4/5